MRQPFYYGTTKKIMVAFATCFDEISIIDGFGRDIRVPLVFSQKEKFIDDANNYEYDMDSTNQDIVFPKMGMEFTGFNFAPERHVNPMEQYIATTDEGEDVAMYNRIPYDISFDLFIGARRLEDTLKIVEQIFPYFTPELTIRIKDKDDFKSESNIPIILNSSALNIDYLGSLDQRRVILWTLNFTAKAYYYPDVRKSERIRQTIVEFRESDYDRLFEKYTATVDPYDASPNGDYRIVEETETNPDE